MTKSSLKRNILAAVCGVVCFASAVTAVVFSQDAFGASAATGDPIESMSLSLQSDLVVKIDVAESVASVTAYVEGESGERLNEATLTEKNGAGQFEYHGVTPQLMGNSVVITAGDFTVKKSVRDYCVEILSKKTNDLNALIGQELSTDQVVKLKTLLDDILNYGSAAQVYKNYNADNLVNAGIVIDNSAHDIDSVADRYTALGGDVMTGEITSDLTEAPESGAYISGAGVRFDNNAGLYFTVVAPDGVENLSVKISKGADEVATLETLTATGSGTYRALYEEIALAQYGEDFTAQVYANGEAVGNKVTLSVNDYVFLMDETGDENFNNLVKSLYVFNQSALAFSAADAAKNVTAITGYELTQDGDTVYLTISGTQTGYAAEELVVDYDNNVWGTQETTISENTFSVKINLTAEIEKNPAIVSWQGAGAIDNFPHLLANGGEWNGTDGNVPAIGETQTIETDMYTYTVQGHPQGWGMAIVRIAPKETSLTVDTASNRLEVGEDGNAYWVIDGTYFGYTEEAAATAVDDLYLDVQILNNWTKYVEEGETAQGNDPVSQTLVTTVTATDGKWTMKIDLSCLPEGEAFMHFSANGQGNNYYGSIAEGATTSVAATSDTGSVSDANAPFDSVGLLYRYEMSILSGFSGGDEWKNGLVAVTVSDVNPEATTASIALSEDGTKVLYAVHGTWDNTKITKEEAENAKYVLNLQKYQGDWYTFNLEKYELVVNDDGTFVAYYDVTKMESNTYYSHFNADDVYNGDLKPQTLKDGSLENVVELGGKTYRMSVDPTTADLWGCVGLRVS